MDGEGPFTLAADASGNIWSFGYNSNGKLGNGQSGSTGVPQNVLTIPFETTVDHGPSVRVSAGHFSCYAFNIVTGQSFAWERNSYGELTSLASDPQRTPLDNTVAVLDHGPNMPSGNR